MSAHTTYKTQPNSGAAQQRISVTEARALFSSGHKYLNACTLGLPPQPTIDAMTTDLRAWEHGEHPQRYDEVVTVARNSYAQLINVPNDWVAVGSQSSVLAALIADSIPSGCEVICVTGDFSSMVFPFLQQKRRNITVRCIPVCDVAESITENTWLVAFSLVQSATGEIADIDAIRSAAKKYGAYTLCDTTQATGWMPITGTDFDATICHSYKWLCSPRGAAFLTISPEFTQHILPTQAGWYAGEDPWTSCYGPEMTLASSARRFDVSPAWPVWVGAATSLQMFTSLNMEEVRQHCTQLGNTLCEMLDLPPNDQAIVTWDDPDGYTLARLTENGIAASGRAGRVRVAFHIWNDLSDVNAVIRALKTH